MCKYRIQQLLLQFKLKGKRKEATILLTVMGAGHQPTTS
jgi:hypothetical protein